MRCVRFHVPFRCGRAKAGSPRIYAFPHVIFYVLKKSVFSVFSDIGQFLPGSERYEYLLCFYTLLSVCIYTAADLWENP